MAVRAETLTDQAPTSATRDVALSTLALEEPGVDTQGADSFFGLSQSATGLSNPYVLFSDVLSVPSFSNTTQSNAAALVVHFDAVNNLDTPGPVPLPGSIWLLLAALGAVAVFGRGRSLAEMTGAGNMLWRCGN
jgi:hypothetical protein